MPNEAPADARKSGPPQTAGALSAAPGADLGNERYTRVWFRRMFIALGIYFIARIFVRIDVSNTPEMDEAEQLIHGQFWAWGYGPQPPLYTWIQKLFFALFGFNLFSLAVLKHLILLGTCVVTALSGREFAQNRAGALLAVSALLCVPHFVWSSQNDLTHSILAVFLVAVTVWNATQLLRNRSWANYLLFGICAAAGVLSKYNYAAFLIVLLLAAGSIPETRRLLFNVRMAAALGIALLLLAPHLNWMRLEPELAFRKVRGLHAAAEESLIRGWFRGFTTLAVSLAAYVAPMALVCGLAHGRWPKLSDFWPGRDSSLPVKLAQRIVVLSVIFFVLAGVLFQARFKERWIHPNLFVLPLLLAAVPANWPRLVVKRFVCVAAIVATVVFMMLPGLVLLAAVTGQPHRQNFPYEELLEKACAGRMRPDLILAWPHALGGAAKLRDPNALVVTSADLPVPTDRITSALIVWDASEKSEPDVLKRFAAKLGFAPEVFAGAEFVEQPLKYVPKQTRRMGFVFVGEGRRNGR